jgi:hypothetical protein
MEEILFFLILYGLYLVIRGLINRDRRKGHYFKAALCGLIGGIIGYTIAGISILFIIPDGELSAEIGYWYFISSIVLYPASAIIGTFLGLINNKVFELRSETSSYFQRMYKNRQLVSIGIGVVAGIFMNILITGWVFFNRSR